MKTLKQEWINWIILVIPIIFIAFYWSQFPSQVPVHFNMDGEPDNYQPKITGLILLPGINVITYLLLLYLPKIDPHKKNYILIYNKYAIIRTIIHLFLGIIIMLTCLFTLGFEFNFTKTSIVIVTIMFLVFGNYLGNLRQNYFVGIRVPWTLNNEKVWKLTHQFAGKLWVICSFIMLITIIFIKDYTTLFIIYISIIMLVPIVYSYKKFRTLVNE